MTSIPLEIGACFYDDSSGIPISVMLIDEDDPIYFISIRTMCDGVQLICQFAPVHRTILDDFIKKSRYVGVGKPQQTYVDEDTKVWKESNSGHKTYFTIPIEEIFAITLNSARLTEESFKKPVFLLPNVFPSNGNPRNQAKPEYEYLDIGVCGRTIVDQSLN